MTSGKDLLRIFLLPVVTLPWTSALNDVHRYGHWNCRIIAQIRAQDFMLSYCPYGFLQAAPFLTNNQHKY